MLKGGAHVLQYELFRRMTFARIMCVAPPLTLLLTAAMTWTADDIRDFPGLLSAALETARERLPPLVLPALAATGGLAAVYLLYHLFIKRLRRRARRTLITVALMLALLLLLGCCGHKITRIYRSNPYENAPYGDDTGIYCEGGGESQGGGGGEAGPGV